MMRSIDTRQGTGSILRDRGRWRNSWKNSARSVSRRSPSRTLPSGQARLCYPEIQAGLLCMAESPARALTIGHSNHPIEILLGLLKDHQVEIVVDTRSQPYSKYSPQFDREALKTALVAHDIRYIHMGKELGGRPTGAEFYDSEGHVLYDRVAGSRLFQEGLARLEKGLGEFRAALLCREENPAGCHRRLLIGRVLGEHGVAIDRSEERR